jgi:hypothetical protein
MNNDDMVGFKYIPQPPPVDIVKPRTQSDEPTLDDLVGNFYGFMSRLAVKGFKTVPKEVYEERTGICERCHFYDKSARLGLGKCNHKGCGCTKLKRYFAFEKCPVGSWGEYAT